MAVIDSWKNMCAIPFRCEPQNDIREMWESIPFDLSCGNEDLETASIKCTDVNDTVTAVWSTLLARAAGSMTRSFG